jgi:hypothetical protein
MEYVLTIFGLNMMVKSGLEKNILKFLQAQNYFPLLQKREEFCLKLQIHL